MLAWFAVFIIVYCMISPALFTWNNGEWFEWSACTVEKFRWTCMWPETPPQKCPRWRSGGLGGRRRRWRGQSICRTSLGSARRRRPRFLRWGGLCRGWLGSEPPCTLRVAACSTTHGTPQTRRPSWSRGKPPGWSCMPGRRRTQFQAPHSARVA